MKIEKSIELALKTWYPPEHELHFNPHHPLGKLLGEWGELLDEYMKSLYKPGYQDTGKFLDELGDIWYYIRIFAYQQGMDEIIPYTYEKSYMPDKLIANAMKIVVQAFENLEPDQQKMNRYAIWASYTSLLKLLELRGVTLDELTALNWQKLQPGSVRGGEWMDGR